MINHRPLPSQEELKERLDYNPETGELRWKVSLANHVKVGSPAGYAHGRGYLAVSINNAAYKAHRIIWMWWYGEDPGELEVDHKDRVKSNNRINNLRLATSSQQEANKDIRCDNESGFRGVSFHKSRGRWCARIKRNGRDAHLGLFNTPEEAAAAYQQAAEEIQGEFRVEETRHLPAPPQLPIHLRPRSDNTSGLRGASWVKESGKWKAQIGHKGKRIHLGYFDTAEEAHAVYVKAKEEINAQKK